MKNITFAEYQNKVSGGWIGKCAGGILGAPIEGYKTFNDIIIDDKLFDNNFPNDDLDLQILWLDMARKKGPFIRSNDYREHWINHVDFPWNEYGIATINIKKGLDNPDTGRLNNDFWNQSMGSPIRSEIWGMLCPGHPEKAAFYAKMDSTLDHTGFSVDAEMFFSAAAAIAFFENDIVTILSQAFDHVSGDSTFSQLYRDVTIWYTSYGEEVTKYKVKSKYGDADFTSAPQNVGLTILSLLAFGDSFDNILKSINYGHDSDCIIATAAALIGIVKGYDAIPQIWKDRIGNELMVSPEITGIQIPKTVDELSVETCKTGLVFVQSFDSSIKITEAQVTLPRVDQPSWHLTSQVSVMPNMGSGHGGQLTIAVENFEAHRLEASISLESAFFESASPLVVSVEPGETKQFDLQLDWRKSELLKLQKGSYDQPNLPYALNVNSPDGSACLEKAIPYYGCWIMAGPFIMDDQSLVPMNKKFPDHGLASMPSVAYMHHDRIERNKEHLEWSVADQLFNGEGNDLPFENQLVHAMSHTISLGDYFYGLGERTVYLLSRFQSEEGAKKWLSIGATAYIKVWHNKKLSYVSDEIKRSWPMAHNAELKLTECNEIIIRLDFTVDNFDVRIGFKEHKDKHPHQSQWDAYLIPSLQQLNILEPS